MMIKLLSEFVKEDLVISMPSTLTSIQETPKKNKKKKFFSSYFNDNNNNNNIVDNSLIYLMYVKKFGK